MKAQKLCIRPADAENTLDVDMFVWIACAVESDMYVAITDRDKARKELRDTKVFIIEYHDASLGKDASHQDIYKDVGYIGYRRQSDMAAYITELAVHPDYQGRGIGSAVMELIMSILEDDEGFKHLSLHTHPNNPAKRLYEYFGFHEGETVENFHGSGQPRIFMTCRL